MSDASAGGTAAPTAAPANTTAPAAPTTPSGASAPAATTTKSPPTGSTGGTAPDSSAAPAGGTEGQTAATATATDGTTEDLLDLQASGAKYVKLTIGGKEERIKVTEALAMARKGIAADRRFEEASTIRKTAEERISQVERLEQMLNDDAQAEKVLERIMGERLDRLAERRLAERMRREAMSPEERKAAELADRERALEARQRQLEQHDAKTRQEAEEKAQAERAAAARPQIEKALRESLGDMGTDDRAFSRLRSACRDYIAETGQPLTREVVADLAAEVREGLSKEDEGYTSKAWERERSSLSSLEGDALIKALEERYGADAVEKIRKADLARLKAQQVQQRAAEAPRQPNGQFAKTEPRKVRTLEEVLGRR